MSQMRAYVNFHGLEIECWPDDIANELPADADDDVIRQAVVDDFNEALRQDFPSWYSNDIGAVVVAVRAALAARDEDV